MLDITIRPLLEQDLTSIEIIEKTCFGPEGMPKTEMEAECGSPHTCVMVASLGRVIVGYVMYRIGLRGENAWITRLVVHPIIRRKGVACQLIRKVVERIRTSREVPVRAEVRETDLPVQLFLRSQSFKAIRIRPGTEVSETSYLFEYQPAVASRPHAKLAAAAKS